MKMRRTETAGGWTTSDPEGGAGLPSAGTETGDSLLPGRPMATTSLGVPYPPPAGHSSFLSFPWHRFSPRMTIMSSQQLPFG